MKLLLASAALLSLAFGADAATADGKHKLVLIAGKPSHPPRMHEFNAGVQLLAGCLKDVKDLEVKFVLNGWPQDESVFDGADAIIFYMDGGKKHEALQDGGKRLAKIDEWVKKGMSIGCLHYGVTVDPPDNGGDQFKRWIGGHYEENYSCNPLWEPNFVEFPQHPITRGVKPFQIKDEWYFNIRFAEGFAPNVIIDKGKQKFTPILVARPSDAVRNGPYVYPAGPYPHIQAAKGRQEAMMWAVERPDGGRGLGFTGGHFHDNWGNDEFRKIVLNALVWLAKLDVPKDGIASTVTKEQLEANLDPKPQPKKKTAAVPVPLEAKPVFGAVPGQPRRPAAPQPPPAPAPRPQPAAQPPAVIIGQPPFVVTPTTPRRFGTRNVGSSLEVEATETPGTKKPATK
jgi:hypothetical protein